VTAKAENLDIFRGNQVWLKMVDGNVVFYSHLSAIAPGLYVGKKVSAGELFGNIGISGVPDKDYNNPHLHFEIAENPLTPKTKPADLHDMLLWPYLGSNLSRKSVLSLQNSLFYNGLFAKK
jgi:murein DD-endopeptidase MepM/ murein hydrolase activator NlpD